MLLGIGYLPRKTGPRLWSDFDVAEIKEDLAHIAALGIQALRIPLFWADFQPSAARIDPRAFDRFGRFLDIAEEVGLQVAAGLWTGFWDGALWWPDWGILSSPLPPHWPLLVNESWLTWGRMRSPFVDDRMRSAQRMLIHELVAFYADHPALWGWELLSGFGRLSAAHDRDDVRRWMEEMMAGLVQAASDPKAFFLIAFDALENLNALSPADILVAGGEPGLSLATFASDRRHRPLSLPWTAFALRFVQALSGGPLSLFLAGLPTAPPGQRAHALDGVYYASEEEAATYLTQVIALARSMALPSFWFWRWADIPEAHWHAPPYDRSAWRRHTGLLRADGSEKPLVRALAAEEESFDFPELEVDLDAYRHDPYRYLDSLWKAFDFNCR
ncbi:MAG TPA: hypothetical protein EYP25_10110 [Anaerolineae bacterium]|nr:hypothetical protein [Caldilineae bacterium]HID34896.1 hypothetical protein [Anaerolineae bacterium]HIQ11285.1 hypothetical protein [Caldilineales bacterium]